MASSPVIPDAPKSRIPRRSPGRMVAAICISMAVLCGLPLLPSPGQDDRSRDGDSARGGVSAHDFLFRVQAAVSGVPQALPLGYEGEECQACGAPLDLKSAKPAARV